MENPWRQPDLGKSCQREEPKRCRSDAGQGWGKQVPWGTSPNHNPGPSRWGLELQVLNDSEACFLSDT